MLTDAHRTQKRPPVCSVDPSSVVSHHLTNLLFSRLSAQVVEYTEAVDIYVTLRHLVSLDLSSHTHILYIDIEVVKGPKAQTVFLADISLSGRFLCHHGNPASGIVSS